MKGKKSCGLETICGFSLKISSEVLFHELKYLINLSIRTGRYCHEWKKSKITPIFKNKGSRFERKFYRPVSNLSEISKCCEMAIYDQLYTFFDSNGLFHNNHHGFIRNRSTVTAVQQLRDYWLKNVDKGNLCSALLLDLSAGFDVINVNIFLKKMKIYSSCENTIAWFKDFLTDRSQCVQVESKLSSFLSVPWGVRSHRYYLQFS